jgi:phosphoribosylanthranilate isomerase
MSRKLALRLGADKVHLVDIASEKELELSLKEIPDNEIKLMQYHFTSSTSKITRLNDKLALNCYKILVTVVVVLARLGMSA